MSTEIRFEAEDLDVRAYVDEVGAVNLVLRLDDRDERDRSYVSLAGPPAEIRATLARLLGVTNAVARSLDELAALEEPAEPAAVIFDSETADEDPTTCNDCGRPIVYGPGEAWHHAEEPERGCFLIGPEPGLDVAELAERARTFAAAGGLKDADR